MSQRSRRSAAKQNRTHSASARSPAERLEPGRAPSRPRGLDAREPSRAVERTVRAISAVFTMALVAMVSAGALGFVVYHQFEKPGPLESARTIVIPRGEGRIAIAERLEREGIISNRWTFVGGQMLSNFIGTDKSMELKAGEYELAAGASMRDVLAKLSEGKSILYKVTVPEGLTSEQIIARLRADPTLSGTIDVVPPEGSLLPDTYLVSKGTARSEIVTKMRTAMEKLVMELWEKRSPDLPLRSPEEAVTFASIVEKETGRADERARVAAVFHNRLKKGMRLQSDPTIIYGLVGGEGSLGRSITRSDIASETAYNTYRINGLPPGPIANPGRDALEATFAPAETAELYFVADGTGGHVFSETLEQHNAAVREWRKIERAAKEQADDAATEGATALPEAPITPAEADGPKPLLIRAPPPAPKKDESSSAETPTIVNAAPAQAPAADIPLPIRRPRID